ncbi:LysR family transcriptional regulator [Micromonospora haikouensis]|uniref:LysR family transcriptional regulator n=1 Tax=Micromonospora haikouensis TaxID=686309 RepID=UPI0037BBB75F
MSVPGSDGFMAVGPGLLDTTFDQLRTLMLVAETGSALGAARALGREQSSVQKQLDTLNRNFQQMCGELLVIKQGRGQPFLFTPSGQQFIDLARETLETWQASVNDARRRLGQTIAVGTTEFTLGLLGRVWQRVSDEFTSREIELKVLHVRTKDAFTRLDTNEVDLMCGGLASAAGHAEVPDQYDFLEWHREGLTLLTNLPRRELPVKAVGVDRLPSVPLVIPSGGVIVEFLKRWYGADYRNHLTIVASIDDIYYGLALLRSGMAHGCMIVSEAIGQDAVEGRLPGGPDFRLVAFAEDFDPMLELVTGVFARKGERQQYAPTHPLNMLWHAFVEETRSANS